MKVIIVEDEKLAVDRLELLLRQIEPSIHIAATLESVEDCVSFLRQAELPADLLLMDIHLADGSAFEIFRQVDVTIPIIFTTAYDRYAIDAFKVLSVDYLLKPITQETLAKALEKMRLLRSNSSFSLPSYQNLATFRFGGRAFKSRLLGRVGQKMFFIKTTDIATISADNRIVEITTIDKAKYLIDQTLEELQQELDPSSFFRINRSMIVHAAAIDQVKPFINHRLRLILKAPLHSGDLIISRDRVTDFKKWANS